MCSRPAALGGEDAVVPDREDAVVADEVEARGWNEGSEFLHELQRRKKQVRGPVRPGRLEREGERVLVHHPELARGERRTNHVSAQMLEPVALIRLDAVRRVERESAGAQPTMEIGIPKVLGATVSGIVLLLSKDFPVLVIVALMLSTPLFHDGPPAGGLPLSRYTSPN
jgi:hypothetical protein